ncbi:MULTISPECIES: DsbA family protein [unclassified Dysgonomonas]|uniref:DsbA family oxidoreductase n=1 Tax=unclassified Dysgonomonas TaxID=2630389 RepID=UPI0024737846|nr:MULTISPECIES: DsbA family oxidoreductase [unclassified Dysgonomonas]
MKIEIWSDIACPYCYIGKRKLDRALTKFPHADEVELVWHSYELNPKLPKQNMGLTYAQYFSMQNDCSLDDANDHLSGIVKLAKDTGLAYNFDNLIVTNTSDSLRLVKLAKKYNFATETEEALFKAYFVDGECISDRKVLVRLGVEIGIPKEEIENMLDSDLFKNDLEADIRYSEDVLNLQFIPFYVFNNKEIIQGIISEDEYLEVLNKSYAEWKASGVAETPGDIISGQACSIDGKCS